LSPAQLKKELADAHKLISSAHVVAVAADAPAEASDDDLSLISFAHTNSNSLSNFGASSSSSNLQHMKQTGRRYRYAIAGVDMLTHIMSVKASLSQWEGTAFGLAGVAWYFARLHSYADML